MKKIIGLSLVLIIAVALSGIGTFAYLTDHAASSGNSFVAGTLDLKTNDADSVTQTLYAVGMSARRDRRISHYYTEEHPALSTVRQWISFFS